MASVEYLERLTVRSGARILAVLVRPRANSSRVLIQSCDDALSHLKEVVSRGVSDWGPDGAIIVDPNDRKFLPRIASQIARAFGFTAVLEHADT